MQAKVPLSVKIGAWFLASALTGAALGVFINPNPSTRVQKTAIARYTSGSQRLVRLNLKKRSGT